MPESRDPSTGEVWKRYASTTTAGVRDAVRAAREGRAAWEQAGLAARIEVIERFRRLLYDARLDVANLIARENGKPAGEALAAEVLIVLDFAASYARSAPFILRPQRRPATTPLMFLKRVTVTYVPHGVVGVIAPWNYPLMLPAGILLPALVAGNAVVLKPSEFTPTTALRLVELLHEAGVPWNVVTALPGDGSTGAALIDAGVDKVSFTGSVATGRKVAAACGERLIPCSLELGGSDAAIVLEDADIDRAAAGIAWGRFSNAGQTCVAPKRVFVADAVYDRFAERMKGEVERLSVMRTDEPGGEVGALIRPSQAVPLRAQLADALATGGSVLAQRALPAHADDGWFAPTVVEGVNDSSRVIVEETFGPLLPLIRVSDEAEAVRRANESSFGLAASVWSGDAARARRVALRLDVGAVAINDVAVVAGLADVPHGGVKASGIGRAHGKEGLLEMVRTHTTVENRIDLGRQQWWFRYGTGYLNRFDTFVRLAHGSLSERLRALAALPRALRRR